MLVRIMNFSLQFSALKFTEISKQPRNMAIQKYSYFKKETIFASDLYAIHYGSHTDGPLMLHLFLLNHSHTTCFSITPDIRKAGHKPNLLTLLINILGPVYMMLGDTFSHWQLYQQGHLTSAWPLRFRTFQRYQFILFASKFIDCTGWLDAEIAFSSFITSFFAQCLRKIWPTTDTVNTDIRSYC